MAWVAGGVAEPGLLDVCVGHAGDVVGDCLGCAFRGDAGLMVGGEQRGVLGPGAEERVDDFFGVGVLGGHDGGFVQAVVEELLGGFAPGLDCGAELSETSRSVTDVGESLDAEGPDLNGGFAHQVGDQGVEHSLERFEGEHSGAGGGECVPGERETFLEERDFSA